MSLQQFPGGNRLPYVEPIADGEGASMREMRRERNFRLRLIFGMCIAWALCSLAPIWKYLSYPKAATATLAGLLSIALGMYWLDRLNRRDHQISLGWFLLLYVVLSTAFVILYPISLKHTLNHGSDREDALRIELTAVRHHQYPYDTRTFLGNPPTPLPGAMLLAVPFFEIGHIAWQNFLWLALFFCFTIRFFRYRATALLFLTVLLLFALSNLSDLTSGGDYLANLFYVIISMMCFAESSPRQASCFIPAAIFLGLTLSSRGIYFLVLIPMFVLTLQRVGRVRTAILFGIVLATATLVTIPIFLPHPVTNLLRQLGQNSDKLRYIPNTLHPQWTIPLLALAVICSSFFVRMNLPRLFLILGASSFVMLAPPIATLAAHMGKLPYECSYLSVSVLFFSLWALSKYELASEATYISGRQSLPSTEEAICNLRSAS